VYIAKINERHLKRGIEYLEQHRDKVWRIELDSLYRFLKNSIEYLNVLSLACVGLSAVLITLGEEVNNHVSADTSTLAKLCRKLLKYFPKSKVVNTFLKEITDLDYRSCRPYLYSRLVYQAGRCFIKVIEQWFRTGVLIHVPPRPYEVLFCYLVNPDLLLMNGEEINNVLRKLRRDNLQSKSDEGKSYLDTM